MQGIPFTALLLRPDHPMSLLNSAKRFLARTIDRVKSIFRRPPPPRQEVPAIPAPLLAALETQASRDTGPVATPTITLAPDSTPAPSTVTVALSTDDRGLVQWHLLEPGEALADLIARKAAEARELVVAHLPRLTLGGLQRFEQSWGKPAMKRLPERSRRPDLNQAPTLQQAGELWDLARSFFDFRSKTATVVESGHAPVLILIHGIFDRVFGAAFSPLLLWGDLLEKLYDRYDGRVYGFDHETLAVDPLQNARDLVDLLPRNTPIDILCHSRGGLVTRALLEHPELQHAREHLELRKVIFMGAANEGSQLADFPGDLLKIFTWLFHIQVPTDAEAPHFLVKAANALGSPAASLPGIAALRPASDLIRSLSRTKAPTGVNYTFIRANFKRAEHRILQRVEPIAGHVFGTELNDLVVPFNGMTVIGGAAPTPEQLVTLGDADTPQGRFYHLNYLDSPDVRKRISMALIDP
jgi:hypothetical protein